MWTCYDRQMWDWYKRALNSTGRPESERETTNDDCKALAALASAEASLHEVSAIVPGICHPAHLMVGFYRCVNILFKVSESRENNAFP